jgi:hypothetical protein
MEKERLPLGSAQDHRCEERASDSIVGGDVTSSVSKSLSGSKSNCFSSISGRIIIDAITPAYQMTINVHFFSSGCHFRSISIAIPISIWMISTPYPDKNTQLRCETVSERAIVSVLPEMVNLARVQKAANETLGSEFKPETYW